MPHPANRLNTIRLVKGQTKTLTVTVKTQSGAASSLNGATVYFTAQPDNLGAVVIAKVSPDGIEITDAANGIFTVTLGSDETSIPVGKYRYDIWVEFPHAPPVRHPVVRMASMIVEDAVTQFA